MTKVKYIRVSTEEQNISRQHINSKEFSVYTDKTSGTIQFSLCASNAVNKNGLIEHQNNNSRRFITYASFLL